MFVYTQSVGSVSQWEKRVPLCVNLRKDIDSNLVANPIVIFMARVNVAELYT